MAASTPTRSPAPQVAILVSEDHPAYREVGQELARLLGSRANLQTLFNSNSKNTNIINEINENNSLQVVSIGLSAAALTKSLKSKQVVFCQVFNYQEYGLLNSRHKGISMLPSFRQSFRIWRSLSPGLQQVGIITGPGFDDVLEVAHAAARANGLKLVHEEVRSDKEYLYVLKKMSRKVQGYWIMQDNRILSENTLRDSLSFSVQNGKQVLVFNKELLDLGGLLSLSVDTREVAQLVFDRLEQAQNQDTIPGPDIIYTEKPALSINAVMAKNLGIRIPEQYRAMIHAP